MQCINITNLEDKDREGYNRCPNEKLPDHLYCRECVHQVDPDYCFVLYTVARLRSAELPGNLGNQKVVVHKRGCSELPAEGQVARDGVWSLENRTCDQVFLEVGLRPDERTRVRCLACGGWKKRKL